MEVKGVIKQIDNTKNVTTEFRKRMLVVTTQEEYPQHISIQFSQDRCELLNDFAVGDEVEVGINLRGREWTNKEGVLMHFNTIEGWRISKSVAAPKLDPKKVVIDNTNEPEDLPF